MSRSFMYGTRLQEIEQMMMSVPNFLPRGKGMIIMGKNMIDEKEEFKKCDYCSEFAKGVCTASHCLYMTERIGYGLIHYHHIVADRFSDFSNRFFKKRLRQLVRSFRGEWFLSSYHNDRYSYFPEFNYKTYWRLLERMGGGSFEFKKNNYSTYKNRIHFTPVWFPNGSYVVNTWVIDSWTPMGMLSANLTDTLNIRGSVWDDWHIGPLNP